MSLPAFKKQGALKAYAALGEVVERVSSAKHILEPGDVSVGTNDEELLKRLRAAGRKKNQISVGRYMTGTGLQGMFLEGAYIYRLTAPRAAPAQKSKRGLSRSRNRVGPEGPPTRAA